MKVIIIKINQKFVFMLNYYYYIITIITSYYIYVGLHFYYFL